MGGPFADSDYEGSHTREALAAAPLNLAHRPTLKQACSEGQIPFEAMHISADQPGKR